MNYSKEVASPRKWCLVLINFPQGRGSETAWLLTSPLITAVQHRGCRVKGRSGALLSAFPLARLSLRIHRALLHSVPRLAESLRSYNLF